MSTATISPVLPLTASEIAEAVETYRATVVAESVAEADGTLTVRAQGMSRIAACRAEDEIRQAGHRSLALLLSAERIATLAAARTFRPGISAAERAEAFRATALRTDAVESYLRDI